jgi:hypothetical protein
MHLFDGKKGILRPENGLVLSSCLSWRRSTLVRPQFASRFKNRQMPIIRLDEDGLKNRTNWLGAL